MSELTTKFDGQTDKNEYLHKYRFDLTLTEELTTSVHTTTTDGRGVRAGWARGQEMRGALREKRGDIFRR